MVKKSNKKTKNGFIKYIDAILNTPNLDDKNGIFLEPKYIKSKHVRD